MDNIKEWTCPPLPELLTRASCRKDWKGSEFFLMSAPPPPPPPPNDPISQGVELNIFTWDGPLQLTGCQNPDSNKFWWLGELLENMNCFQRKEVLKDRLLSGIPLYWVEKTTKKTSFMIKAVLSYKWERVVKELLEHSTHTHTHKHTHTHTHAHRNRAKWDFP